MKIGVLTGGGDCPGLNAVIRAIVKKAALYDHTIVGIKSGWQGMIKGETIPLDPQSVSGILPKGGTILGTSRTNPLKKEGDLKKTLDNYKTLGLDALIAIGGEDTLGVADKLFDLGINVVGVPKTIDNDLACTDYTFGFDTAISIVTEAIDRLHSTAESHDRIMVDEVMGRHAGWIATLGGMAGGADCILVPELPFKIDDIVKLVQKRHKRGRNFSIIVVAEGVQPPLDLEINTHPKENEKDAFGHERLGGISNIIADEVKKRTGYDTRVTILGHVQRGGSPTAFDRILATRFGVKAIEFINEKKFGMMVSLQGNKIVPVRIKDAVAKLKTIDMEFYEIAKVFFG